MAIGLPTASGTARLVANCVLAAGFSGCTGRPVVAGAVDGTDGDGGYRDGWEVEWVGTANLRAVSGVGSDVYVVGEAGTILHHDAAGWAAMESGTEAALTDVWAVESDLVITVGYTWPLRWNGRSWSPIPSPEWAGFEALWGASTGEVFATGTTGESGGVQSQLWVWSETEWKLLATVDGTWCVDLWGNSPSDIYAACWTWGKHGSPISFPLAHYDGERLLPVLIEGQECSGGRVWSAGPKTLYLLGCPGLMRREDGQWRELEEVNALLAQREMGGILGLGGAGPNDVYAVGSRGLFLHFDGEEWSVVGPLVDVDLNAVWVGPDGAVVVVGNGGAILRRPAAGG